MLFDKFVCGQKKQKNTFSSNSFISSDSSLLSQNIIYYEDTTVLRRTGLIRNIAKNFFCCLEWDNKRNKKILKSAKVDDFSRYSIKN
ncbi:hypothetical protein EHP00_225 [Ecytonucleospora hepatopenaei]|uniref:Uncharacterized protein n=1 Tax=Ecytonucleospora hepatopenaei TaxID=646526 RepID=A0A1W0E6R9_9MICR|nr:hypothetical protein EHP00_225 [Ecytonucleospora hepatopenaei]